MEDFMKIERTGVYCSIHSHDDGSNIISPDVAIGTETLILKAKENGCKAIAITNHGNTVTKFLANSLCKKHGIQYILGVESYFVLDINSTSVKKDKNGKETTTKDRSNSHMVILAKTAEGIKQINRIVSHSNVEGFYGKPRIDLDSIRKFLNPKDIIISSACIGSFLVKYGFELIEEFHSFIKEGSFYLEIAYHPNNRQKEYNRKLREYSQKYGIPLVVGLDVHGTDSDTAFYRQEFLKGKKIVYEGEEEWYIDFPSYDEIVLRFLNQGVFSEDEIIQALEQTNEIADKCEPYNITQYKLKVPLPIKYRTFTEEQRKDKLKEIVYNRLNELIFVGEINANDFDKYDKEIEWELNEINTCNMQDYFLLNYDVIKLGKEKFGGVLTFTGRGSSPGFIVNMFLGFTAIDRLQFPDFPILPERFLTANRVIESHTCPDIDMNMADPKPFELATKELLGDNMCYPMIALGKFQVKSSWKMYSKVKNIPFDIANNVSDCIETFTKAKKYASEEEQENIDILDFIPQEYIEIFNGSKDLRGIIDNIKPHACGYLVSPDDIIENIGLIRVGKDDNDEAIICAGIDGYTATDVLGYVKNDYLTVSVVDIINKIYKEVGIPQPTPRKLLEDCEKNPKIWDIYANGQTYEVNQFSSADTITKCKKFLPKNISDLSVIVAGIRPGAISIISKIVNREKFEFGSKNIDDILYKQTGIGSFMLYQESLMKILEWIGTPQNDTYKLMKSIGRKNKKNIDLYKKDFIERTSNKLIEENSTYEESKDISKKLWDVVENSASYSFNASHSMAVALDSLYIAHAKIMYFKETYAVLLKYYLEGSKRDLAKTARCKIELKSLGYDLLPPKLGQDNTKFSLIGNGFTQSLMSAKSMNQPVIEFLSTLKEDTNFFDVYVAMKSKEEGERSVGNKRIWDVLCKVEYFSNQTSGKKALRYIPTIYEKIFTKKQFRETSMQALAEALNFPILENVIDINKYISRKTAKTYYLDEAKKIQFCTDVYNALPNDDCSPREKIQNEIDCFGYLASDFSKDKIFSCLIKAVSYKNKSVLLLTSNGGEVWNDIQENDVEISSLKKGMTLVIFESKQKIVKGAKRRVVVDWIGF